MEEFFLGETFWEKFFERNFLGEFFLEEFVWGIIFWEELFGRNSLFTSFKSAKLIEYERD